MIAEPQDLVVEGSGGHLVVLRVPLVPELPLVAAAPPGHDQEPVLVGEVVEELALQLPLEADGVEAHLARVAQLGLEPLAGRGPEHHVGSPAPAADEDRLAVDLEEAVALRRQLGASSAGCRSGPPGGPRSLPPLRDRGRACRAPARPSGTATRPAGFFTASPGTSCSVNRTVVRSRGPRLTAFENWTLSMAPRSTPVCGRSVVFQTSAVTVRCAVSSDGRSSSADHVRAGGERGGRCP